jgi:hypothetical protein
MGIWEGLGGCWWADCFFGWTYEEHGEVAGSYDCGAGDDGVAGYGEHHEDADVDTAVAGGSCGPGYGDGDEEGCEPDCGGGLALMTKSMEMMVKRTGHGEQQSLDLSISQSLHNAREKVLECLRED